MDHHHHTNNNSSSSSRHNNHGGSGHNNNRGSGGGGGRKKAAAAAAAASALAEQHQRNNLLMEAAALSAAAAAAGGGSGSSSGGGGSERGRISQQQQLAELFAAHHQHQQQQQQNQQLAHHLAALTANSASANSSSSSSNNPLSLLQQQMNAIMQQAPQQPPPTSSSSSSTNNNNNNNSSPFNNPAAAWWYLEYLSRIQAAQIIPNLDQQAAIAAAAAAASSSSSSNNNNNSNNNNSENNTKPSTTSRKKSATTAQQQQQLQLQQQLQQAISMTDRQQSMILQQPPPTTTTTRSESRQHHQQQDNSSSRRLHESTNDRKQQNHQPSSSKSTRSSNIQQQNLIKRKHELNDPLNLSSNTNTPPTPTNKRMKIPKLSNTSITPQQLTSSTSSLLDSLGSTPPPGTTGAAGTLLQPPVAHSTPINLSTPPGKYSSERKEPLPAHNNINKVLYTHMIPKFPQIGLIGNKNPKLEQKLTTTTTKKKTVASLLAQTRTPPPPVPVVQPTSSTTPPSNILSEISYRPWLVEPVELSVNTPSQPNPLLLSNKLIIPSLTKKETPDYSLPLKMGWKREVLVKSLDDLIDSGSLEGSIVIYTTPTGIKCKSQNEIKKQLNQRTAELTPKHFTFNSNLYLGIFIINFEGEELRLEENDLKVKEAANFVCKLQIMKAEKLLALEEFKQKQIEEEKEKEDKERKKQHLTLIKSLEIHKKNKRRIKLQNERRLKKKLALIEELKTINNNELVDDKDVDELTTETILTELNKLETYISPAAFSTLLQIFEFLNTFGETLGFDMDSLPNLENLLKGFINHPENEEELQSILIHLIVCAVEDPGMPNPNKHLTPFNQTLKQADVTFGSLSEILRIYLEGISDSEPEADTYSKWLLEAPFTAHNPGRKTTIVGFLCDILLQNKAVLKHLEQSTELIHNCKKERQQNEIKIRKLRMFFARKQVAAVCDEQLLINNNSTANTTNTTEDNKDSIVVPVIKVEPTTTTTEPKDIIKQEDATTTATTAATAVVVVVKEEESEGEENADAKLSMEEIRLKMTQLQNVNEKLKKQMQLNIKNIRTSCLGQDRYRRRFWNLPHSGGIYIEGGKSGEFNELKIKVSKKFESNNNKDNDDEQVDKRIIDCKNAAKIIHENVNIDNSTPNRIVNTEDDNGDLLLENNEDGENIPPPTTTTTTTKSPVNNNGVGSVLFEVPPPCIKIFSFVQRDSLCSGKLPQSSSSTIDQVKDIGPTDDELLINNITKDKWNYYHVLKDSKELIEFNETLHEKGVREKGLLTSLNNITITKKVPEFDEDIMDHNLNLIDNNVDQVDEELLTGVDPDLVYKIHLGLIETLETLEERVASASLQIKGWTLPLPRNLNNTNLMQSEIIEIVKVRLLDLEQAVERRYLKPPLGKSANELNLSNLVGEDNANALNTNESITNGPPCGSTSSTRGQQIQENNKLKELKEKEERMLAANESKNSCSRFLTHWRDAISKSVSPSVLSMAIYLLDSSIAWDKSVMKASCQLCKGGDNEDKLLLCDACDRGYHTYCFKPPLEQIPEGDWFCWECINKATGNRGCIVCGKGNLQGKKLLACDKCVKAYHTDCIHPPVTKVPRGRWYCPDHQTSSSSSSSSSSKHHHHHHHHHNKSSESGSSCSSPTKKKLTPIIITTPNSSTNNKIVQELSNTTTPISTLTNTTSTPISSINTTTIITPNNSAAVIIPVQQPPLTISPIPNSELLGSVVSPSPSSSGGKKNNNNNNSKKLQREMEWCDKILDDLMNHEDAWPFLEPVNTRQFPTYKKVIKTPMDLQTIRKSLTSQLYKSRDSFLSDVRLIFDNCETFNEDDSPVGKAGHSLRVFFESKTFTTGGTSCDSNLGTD